MNPPKKIYLSQVETETLKHRTNIREWEFEFVSVEWLREWIEKNLTDVDRGFDVIMPDELLKAIEEP